MLSFFYEKIFTFFINEENDAPKTHEDIEKDKQTDSPKETDVLRALMRRISS